jgi:hypothetical protein
LIDFICRVKSCNTDRNIDTSWLLHNDRLFAITTAIWFSYY